MGISDTLRMWAKRIKRDGVTLWFAGKHPKTPWYAKALGLFVVAYALSPIDLIPDFIPVLGYVDDVLLLPGLIWLTLQLLPPDVLTECRGHADAWMQRQGAVMGLLATTFCIANIVVALSGSVLTLIDTRLILIAGACSAAWAAWRMAAWRRQLDGAVDAKAVA